MKRKFDPHSEVTRRSFLSGLVVAAGGTLAPEALSQALAATLPESHRFSIAGADVEFVLTRVSEATLRISLMAKGAGLKPRTTFAGVGLADLIWPAPMAVMDEDSKASGGMLDGRRTVAETKPLTP